MPNPVIDDWRKNQLPLGIPNKQKKPTFLPSLPREALLALGCKALYRVEEWRRGGLVEAHHVSITSDLELQEMAEALREGNWRVCFLYFYEYITYEEWVQIKKDMKEMEKINNEFQ